MTPAKAGRGRPKGTGLNDAAQLRAIANLMAADPDLKPTTAIKHLGITDPSVIRRLRDKFSASGQQLVADIAPRLPFGETTHTATPVAAAPVTVASAGALQAANGNVAPQDMRYCQSSRVVPLAAGRTDRKVEPARPIPAAPASSAVVADAFVPDVVPPRPPRPRHFPLPSETGLSDWVGMGLSLYALSVEAQFAVAASMFQWPPLAAVLKSQVAFTQVAVALTRPAIGSSQPG